MFNSLKINLLILHVVQILLFIPINLQADEWDDHEVAYANRFEEYWQQANRFEEYWQQANTPAVSKQFYSPHSEEYINQNYNSQDLKKTLTLGADRINILLGGFVEIDFKVIELKIQPYIEFRMQKRKQKI